MAATEDTAKLLSKNIYFVRDGNADRTQPTEPLDIIYYKPLNVDASLPTVVFLPFWGGSASTFQAVQRRLSEARADHVSIAVSYPGTGSSIVDRKDDSPEDHDIPALAADVLALLKSLQRDDMKLIPSHKIILCAHSMSAKVAWEVLDTLKGSAEQNFQTTVTGLLLLAPAPLGPLKLPPEMAEQQLQAYNSLESATWTLENVLTYKQLGEEVIRTLARDCVNMTPGAKRGWIELGMKRDCLAVVRDIADTDSLRRNLRVAVLVGDKDPVETADKVKKETVDVLTDLGFVVRLKIVAGVGHLLPVEAPEEVVLELEGLL